MLTKHCMILNLLQVTDRLSKMEDKLAAGQWTFPLVILTAPIA